MSWTPTEFSPDEIAVCYNIVAQGILNVVPELGEVEPQHPHDEHQSTGKLLLHHAMLRAPPTMCTELCRMLVRANPTTVTHKDIHGALPLHLALHNPSCDVEAIEVLITADKKTLDSPDKFGYLPLHWAVNHDNSSVDIVALLLAYHPRAAATACSVGSLPLHWACGKHGEKPTSMSPEDAEGVTSTSSAFLPVAKLLLNAFPDGIRTCCDNGWLPLHWCINRSNVHMDILRLLLDIYPLAAQCPLKETGQLALHLLCSHPSPTLSAVELLIHTYPQSVQTMDDDGYLALHCALDSQSQSLDATRMLLEVYPEGVSQKTKNGWLPLHIALSSEHVSVEVVRHLLTLYPNAVMESVSELVPMHSLSQLQQNQYRELLITSTASVTFSIVQMGNEEYVERTWTPLSKAVERGLDFIAQLIQNLLNKCMPTAGQIEALQGSQLLPADSFILQPNSFASTNIDPNQSSWAQEPHLSASYGGQHHSHSQFEGDISYINGGASQQNQDPNDDYYNMPVEHYEMHNNPHYQQNYPHGPVHSNPNFSADQDDRRYNARGRAVSGDQGDDRDRDGDWHRNRDRDRDRARSGGTHRRNRSSSRNRSDSNDRRDSARDSARRIDSSRRRHERRSGNRRSAGALGRSAGCDRNQSPYRDERLPPGLLANPPITHPKHKNDGDPHVVMKAYKQEDDYQPNNSRDSRDSNHNNGQGQGHSRGQSFSGQTQAQMYSQDHGGNQQSFSDQYQPSKSVSPSASPPRVRSAPAKDRKSTGNTGLSALEKEVEIIDDDSEPDGVGQHNQNQHDQPNYSNPNLVADANSDGQITNGGVGAGNNTSFDPAQQRPKSTSRGEMEGVPATEFTFK